MFSTSKVEATFLHIYIVQVLQLCTFLKSLHFLSIVLDFVHLFHYISEEMFLC